MSTDERQELVARYLSQSADAEHAGPEMVRMRLVAPIVKAKDGKPRVLLSNARSDRHGDVVRPSGAELKDFRKNPVMLFGHRHDIPAVGKWVGIKKDKDGVWATPEFAPTPMGEQLQTLYDGGFMNAWSIGFIPKKWDRIQEDGEDTRGVDVKKWELLEASAVNVGANPDALGPKGLAVTKALATDTPDDVVAAFGEWFKAILAGEETISDEFEAEESGGTSLDAAFPAETVDLGTVTEEQLIEKLEDAEDLAALEDAGIEKDDIAPAADEGGTPEQTDAPLVPVDEDTDTGSDEAEATVEEPVSDDTEEVVEDETDEPEGSVEAMVQLTIAEESYEAMADYADECERAVKALERMAVLKAQIEGDIETVVEPCDCEAHEDDSRPKGLSVEDVTKALDARDSTLAKAIPQMLKAVIDAEMGRVPDEG